MPRSQPRADAGQPLTAGPEREPLAAGLALACTFAEALARKADVTEALAEALGRAIQTRLVTAGCVFERDPHGAITRRACAGFAAADAHLATLCDQPWMDREVFTAGLPVLIPSSRIPRAAAAEILRSAGATTALVLPLVAHGDRLGALVVASRDVDLGADAVAAGARIAAAQVAQALGAARTKACLEASLQLHRTAFEHAHDAILILDDAGRVVAANEQAASVFDRATAELYGRRPMDFVIPEDVQVMMALRAQLEAQGYLAIHRMRIRRADGRVADLDATAARVPAQDGFACVIVLRDMTNRRSSREGLAAGEERFRALVESTGDVIFTLDRALRLTGVFGRRPLDAGLGDACCVGRSLRDALGDAAEVHEAAAQRALAGEIATFEWTTGGPDGPRHLQATYSPVRASAGEVRGLVGVARDVTERRQLQARLLVADHMAALGLLAGSISQELSKPVAAVLTNLSHVNSVLASAQAYSPDGERAVDLAALMHLVDPMRDALGAADRLRRIVQDLRALTRATGERLGAVDVSQALDAAARMAATELKGRVRVVRDYREAPPACGNEARLVQVFLSLIVNAAQACPERDEGLHEIQLATWRDEQGQVVAEVRDSGRGIAPEHLARIFEPFFTTKPPGVGTGLGLSIAQRIVGALGGRIAVETEVGKGTAVRVVLPPIDGAASRPGNDAAERPAAVPEA